jgi:hypothetical protein
MKKLITIGAILSLIVLSLLLGVSIGRKNKTEINRLKIELQAMRDELEKTQFKYDSLGVQIEARNQLIQNLDSTSKRQTLINNRLRYENSQIIKAIADYNANQQLELFTANFGD